MSRTLRILLLLAALAALAASLAGQTKTAPTFPAKAPMKLAPFNIRSTDVATTFASAQILNSFGCSGGNVSPELMWRNAPAGTKSFVLTLFDADAPTGSGFWHWVVINIPASVQELATGASKTARMPAGALETRTDFGAPGYGGPCPPAGDKPHRYTFTVHALKIDKLDATPDTSAALVGFMTHQNELGKATLTVNYGR